MSDRSRRIDGQGDGGDHELEAGEEHADPEHDEEDHRVTAGHPPECSGCLPAGGLSAGGLGAHLGAHLGARLAAHFATRRKRG